MLRTRWLTVGVGLAMVAALAGSAGAQDRPEITVDPSNVAATGETAFVITGTGYTVDSLFVFPCDFPEGGDLTLLGSDSCDIDSPEAAELNDDGGFEIELTFDVPAQGMAVVATDAAQIESAAALITVAGQDDGEGDDDAVEAAAEELPETGAESTTLAIIGLTVAAAGALVIGGSRRLNRA